MSSGQWYSRQSEEPEYNNQQQIKQQTTKPPIHIIHKHNIKLLKQKKGTN